MNRINGNIFRSRYTELRKRKRLFTRSVNKSAVALAYGLLDIIEIFNDLLCYDEDEANYEAFIRELIFREFYYVLMTQYPETSYQAFKSKYRQIKWSQNEVDFNAW